MAAILTSPFAIGGLFALLVLSFSFIAVFSTVLAVASPTDLSSSSKCGASSSSVHVVDPLDGSLCPNAASKEKNVKNNEMDNPHVSLDHESIFKVATQKEGDHPSLSAAGGGGLMPSFAEEGKDTGYDTPLAQRRAKVNQMNAQQIELDFLPSHAKRAREHSAKGKQPRIVGFDQLGNHYTSMNELFKAGFGVEDGASMVGSPQAGSGIAKKGDNDDGGVKRSSAEAAKDDYWEMTDLYDPQHGFYGKVQSYWSEQQPTTFGVTAVSDEYSQADLDETNAFLRVLEPNDDFNPIAGRGGGGNKHRHHRSFDKITLGTGRALDCGTGIGRLAEAILAPRFDVIDLVEPAPQLLEKAKETLRKRGKLGESFATSLELFDLPSAPTYDLINMQWVAMYLTDNDLIDFLRRAKSALRSGTVKKRLSRAEAEKLRLLNAKIEKGKKQQVGNDVTEVLTSQLRRRLASLKRRGRSVLSDAEAAEHDRLEEELEQAEENLTKTQPQKSSDEKGDSGNAKEWEGNKDEEVEVEVKTTGIIFMKENIVRTQHFFIVKGSTSLNRCDAHYRAIFKEAGLKVLRHAMQSKWPSTNVPLGMYALVPE